MTITYSVVGLGKLGAGMAAAIASRGYRVIGVDVNASAVEAIEAGRAPVQETGLQELIEANQGRLRATMSFEHAIAGSDVTFVVVPTPSDQEGAFSLNYVIPAVRSIGKALAPKPGYHLVVITSTVLPGSTREQILPTLEGSSRKRCGANIGLCYSPEFIALGSVVRDFLHPDFTLIGEVEPGGGDLLERCYADILLNSPPCRRMGIENAELTKLAVNSFITTKIAFANMLADLCDRMPGGDVDVVTNAIGLDSRIGGRYLTGGLGFGGPCFPRDNAALAFVARRLGARAPLPQATRLANDLWGKTLLDRIHQLITPGAEVAVLGLAYKLGSGVTEESQGLFLAHELTRRGFNVVAHDPLAVNQPRAIRNGTLRLAASPQECVATADAALITLPDPTFASLVPSDFGRRPVTVIDCWRSVQSVFMSQPGIRYIGVGHGEQHDSAAGAHRRVASLESA